MFVFSFVLLTNREIESSYLMETILPFLLFIEDFQLIYSYVDHYKVHIIKLDQSTNERCPILLVCLGYFNDDFSCILIKDIKTYIISFVLSFIFVSLRLNVFEPSKELLLLSYIFFFLFIFREVIKRERRTLSR